jgi:hypothetical protein
MLLTYRLIFGQDTRSYRLFAKEMASQAKSRKTSPCDPQFAEPDPMLTKLCGLSCDALGVADIYQEIRAQDVQSYYMPNSYPFFAERLLNLQRHVKEQHPHDWKTLWYDHRNKSNWWQFWAVLFIGVGVLILGTLSLTFQIWQAVLTQQQVAQQRNYSPAPQPPVNV